MMHCIHNHTNKRQGVEVEIRAVRISDLKKHAEIFADYTVSEFPKEGFAVATRAFELDPDDPDEAEDEELDFSPSPILQLTWPSPN